MVKERTPLLLAFGAHPGRCGYLALQGDREFFRSSFVPFVEKWVSRQGRKALMIHEYSVACDAGFGAVVEHERKGAVNAARGDMRSVQRRLDSLRLSVNSTLERTLDSGRGLQSGMEWFDWGCADEILRVNRARPGAITSIIEPLVAEAAVLLSSPGTPGLSRLDEEKEAVARAVRICRARSASLAGYIIGLRESHPEMPVIVTRGFAHKAMERFFDASEFDMTSASRLIGAPWPSTEAVIEGMHRELTSPELTRFAALSMHYGEYYEANSLTHMIDCIKDGVFDEARFALLSWRAREYAASKAGS